MSNKLKQDNIFENQPLLTVLILLMIGVGVGYMLQKSPPQTDNPKQNTETQDIQQQNKVFYTISLVNIRECASLSCDVIGQYPINTDLTIPYNSLSEMPGWIQTSWVDNSTTIFGFISKKVLSESRTQIIEKVIEKQQSGLSSVIKSWRPRVAYIECTFQYSNTGQVYSRSSGSGMALSLKGLDDIGRIVIVTNKHVISDEDGYGPHECIAKLPDNGSVYEISVSDVKLGRGIDYGYLHITNPDNYIKNLTSTNKDLNWCQTRAEIGESLVILGYPSYGSDYLEITATEGIISGYDGKYYTTSAKIEQGNSGGVAILQKDNCYLGIPTAVKLGAFESLGRILDVRDILQ